MNLNLPRSLCADHLSHPSLHRKPFDDPAWLFELKLDGFRALARKIGADLAQRPLSDRNSFPRWSLTGKRFPLPAFQ